MLLTPESAHQGHGKPRDSDQSTYCDPSVRGLPSIAAMTRSDAFVDLGERGVASLRGPGRERCCLMKQFGEFKLRLKPGSAFARNGRARTFRRASCCGSWTFRIDRRSLMSGRLRNLAFETAGRSSDPNRSTSAVGGRDDELIPVFPQAIQFQLSSCFRVCSRSSLPPPMPAPRCRPTHRFSSMKSFQRAVLLARIE